MSIGFFLFTFLLSGRKERNVENENKIVIVYTNNLAGAVFFQKEREGEEIKLINF